jgi:hypothetical protein
MTGNGNGEGTHSIAEQDLTTLENLLEVAEACRAEIGGSAPGSAMLTDTTTSTLLDQPGSRLGATVVGPEERGVHD